MTSSTEADSSQEQVGRFKLSQSVLRWVAVGLVLTSAVVIIISLYSGVRFSDFETVGYLTFGLAAAASLGRLLV